MTPRPKVAERLNAALHALFRRHDDLFLLGEDVSDPYGGAFGITRKLSTQYPDRIRSTPISENGILGVASGLALCGNKVIVEVMFGDFLTLGFDQIANFAAKSVTMYGQRKQMNLIVRCPVGGHRGYGPTHSQSIQKHFIGIPNLPLYELSAFHDPETLLEDAFAFGTPAILFEPKTQYGHPAYQGGRIDEALSYEAVGQDGNWIHAHPEPGGPVRAELAVIAPGGTAESALSAARMLMANDDIRVHVLVPRRLYPFDPSPVIEVLARADGICVAEESTAGGTWGAEVGQRLYERLWDTLSQPVRLLSSRDSIIPTAPHLERGVLLQPEDIGDAMRAMATGAAHTPRGQAPAAATVPATGTETGGPPAGAIRVPKLNNNDVSYVLIRWLVDDHTPVQADQPVVEIETSKAVDEILAEASGVLHQQIAEGNECKPGDILAILDSPETRERAAAVGTAAETHELSKAQQQVAALVSAGRRDIPDAFVLRQVSLDALAELQRGLDDRQALPVALFELVVKSVAGLREAFPACFGSLAGPAQFRTTGTAHVGVTMDAGNGLFVPVLHSVETMTVAEVADTLADFGMCAFRGSFAAHTLEGANILVSWNHETDVVFVQPVIPPGLACAVSVGGPLTGARVDADGHVVATSTVNVGLAYDHRLVNGREATAFLNALAAALQDHAALAALCAA
jgi:pyruvate/2-oxoglutarate/acetoin dehydrogenase E1 component/pyruvate/2-oxoglutarate dehydrogenase complex dihydrolipoamide acyltransferase (E2) component